MIVHYNLSQLPIFRNAVLTIGSFDGVHRGHQKIIERVIQMAREQDGESVLITFHPHPRSIVDPTGPPVALITTIHEKVTLLEDSQLDHLVVVPFTKAFANQSPEEYITEFLMAKFQPKIIVIGYDHRFGKERKGDITLLQSYSEGFGFSIVEIEKQEVEDIGISSTKIRNALTEGNLDKANQFLGHPFSLKGMVVKGQAIGTELGFPTANLNLTVPEKIVPADGIFAVWARYNQNWYKGMLYIGTRPTLSQYTNRTIEVNLLDFKRNIYGETLQVFCIQKVRDDIAFDNLDELKAQLARDKENTLKVLENPPKLAYVQEQTISFPEVAVVILNYNGRSFLEDFLPRVLDSSYPNMRLIVADNASTDDSVEFLRENYPAVELIEMTENTGFAGGYNEALKSIDTDYFVLLNSDVATTKGWLEPMIRLMENDKTIAACQPKIKAFSSQEDFEYAGAAGGWMDPLGYPLCKGRIFAYVEKDLGQYDRVSEVFWASGAAMVIRPKLFIGIGGFDADYFAHLEEIDLCWRLKQAGYKIMACPQSVVYHVGGGTLGYLSPRKAYLNFRNSLFTLLKNEPGRKLIWLLPLRSLLDMLAMVLFFTERKFKHIKAVIMAHVHFYKSFRNTLKKKKKYEDAIQKVSISNEFNKTGILKKSVVWSYYVLGKRTFKDLEK